MPPRKDPNLSKSSATYISDLCPSGVTEAAAILAQYRDPQVTPTPAPGTLRTKRRVEYPVQSPAQYSLLLPAAPSLPASGRQSLDMADPPQLAGLPKMSPGKKKRDKLAESILGDDASASSISKSSNSSSSSEEEKKRKKKKSKKKKKKRSRKYSDSDSDQSAARMTKKAKLALQEGFESDSPEEDDILPSQRTRPVSSGLSQMGGVSPSQLAYFGSQAMETAPLSRRQALDRARERPQKALSMADLSKDEIGVIIQYRECIRRNQAEAASRGVAAPGDPPLYQDFERWRVARAQYDARIIPSSRPNVPALIQDRIVSRSPSPSVAAGLSPTLMPPPAYDAVDPVKTRVVKKDPKKPVPASPKLVVKEPKDTRGRSKSSKSSSSKKEGKDKVQIKVEPTSPEDGGREFTTTMKTDDLKEYLRTRGIAEHIAMAVPGSQHYPASAADPSLEEAIPGTSSQDAGEELDPWGPEEDILGDVAAIEREEAEFREAQRMSRFTADHEELLRRRLAAMQDEAGPSLEVSHVPAPVHSSQSTTSEEPLSQEPPVKAKRPYTRKKLPEASLPKPSKKPEEDPKRKSARQKERSVDIVDEFESEVAEDEKKPKSQGNNNKKK